MAGSVASRLTIVGAAKKVTPDHRRSRPAISAPSTPLDAGITLTAPRATCGKPYRPEPCEIGAAWSTASPGPTGSMSAK